MFECAMGGWLGAGWELRHCLKTKQCLSQARIKEGHPKTANLARLNELSSNYDIFALKSTK